MLGIPGTSLIESHFGSALPGFEEASTLLGLDSGNAPPLLSLGDVVFSLNTAALQTLERNTEYTWPEIMRVGQLSRLQFTGPGKDTLTIPGVIYPDWKGSSETVETLRIMARKGEVYYLIAMNGNVLGLYVIASVQETQSYYKTDGAPRKVTFSVKLRRFAETKGDTMPETQDHGLLGGVGKYIHNITHGAADDVKGSFSSGVSDIESEFTGSINSL